MTDPVEAFSDHYLNGEPIFRALLTASTKAESDVAVRQEQEWTRVLLKKKARPMGVDVLAVLQYIHGVEPRERKRFDQRGAGSGASIDISSTSETIQAVEIGYFSDAHARATLTMDVRLTRMLGIIESGKRPKAKSGRKPGQGAYQDEKAVAEIARLVNEKGVIPWAAAQKAVELADPQGTPDIHQRTKRIYGKYKNFTSN